MRPAALVFGVIVFGAAGVGADRLAREGVARFEDAARTNVTAALAGADQNWATVEIDGLVVGLTGTAPDEAAHVRALAIVRSLVSTERIDDRTAVRIADPVAPPDFSLEILRDDGRVSLIGLVPERGLPAIRSALEGAGLGGTVSDMLQTAAQPIPDRWDSSLALGLRALGDAPRSKVSVAPGKVHVQAAVEGVDSQRALEAMLRAARPRDVTLILDITAPRPVVTPYRFDFVSDGETGRMEACSAEHASDVAAMTAAARPLGLAGDPDCAIGLGAPSPDWAEAVVSGLEALRVLGGGRFAIKDIDATLTAPAGVDPTRLAEVGATLGLAMPDVFSTNIVATPRMVSDADGAEIYAPRFNAELTETGDLRLGGALQSATSRDAIESYAAALFGHDRVRNETVVDPSLPDGWPGRVLSGVAALAELREGRLEVTPDRVTLQGEGADVATNIRVKALLAEKLGRDGAQAELTLAPPPPPATAATPVVPPKPPASPPAPERSEASEAEAATHCAEEVTAILGNAQIDFAPGSDAIDPESEGTLLAIADVLRACPRGGFEIGGHTDSQGSTEGNRRLSQRRAEAVVTALGAQLPETVALSAKGHGEEDPIADNDTADGRARNRRITFVAVTPAGDPAPASAQSGPLPRGAPPPEGAKDDGSNDEVVR